MNRNIHTHAGRGSFVDKYYSVASYGARESQKAITEIANETADSLMHVAELLQGVLDMGKKTLKSLKKDDGVCSVEDEVRAVSNYENVEAQIEELYSAFKQKEDSAVRDHTLYGKNERKVVDAYKIVMKRTIDVLRITQKIRWCIMDHAEDYGVISSETMTGDELIKSLG